MTSSTVEVPTADGVADATLARPSQEGDHPGVLFLTDAFGLRPGITAMVERIAVAGYVVLAPNLFYRHGRSAELPAPDLSDPDARSAFWAQMGPRRQALTPAAVRADGAAYLDFLQHLPGVSDGPVGITGYCMGGVLGWRIAADFPDRVAALATFHAGNVVTDQPDSAHLRARDLRAELYLAHADHDRSMSPGAIATVESALDQAGVSYRSEVYAGAGHGFTMADAAAYVPEAAERHFTELLALLARTIAR